MDGVDALWDALWADSRRLQARTRQLEQLLHSDDSSEDEVSCLKLIYLNLIFIEKSVLYGVCELR